ncbi:hypothetical protein FRC02_011053 [Tulasnella sp. 418]|nr:hypothetical protein FRC02_011053 [Tulasnella sp. 418]
MYNKEQEFRAWLIEEQKINPETLSKDASRKRFAQFVEDYNTATLPHEKYYALEPYERRMSTLRNGGMIPQGDEGSYDPRADIAAHSSKLKQRAAPPSTETYLNREQLQELRKVQMERIEAGKMKALGMDIKQSMGVRMDTQYD